MRIDIQPLLEELFSAALNDAGFSFFQDKPGALEFSPATGFGDIATNAALKIGSALKQPPRAIAQKIVDACLAGLEKSSARPYIKEIKAEGAGFINIYLTETFFCAVLSDIIDRKADFARSDAGKGRKVVVEFVSANPTGPLSVAHARQAVVGDALANILEYLGFDAKKEYYLNDEGNQIEILGNSVLTRLRQLNGEQVDFPENYYQGDYIVDMAREIKEKGLDVGNFPEYSCNYILNIIKKELEDFNVRFDCWYSQKTLRESGKQKAALEYLKEKGFLYEQDGAVWFRSTDFGDDKDRVVVKSDGTFTYLAPDIAYHRTKFDRGFEWLINLWGPDHHGYIPRLKAAVMALGGKADSLNVVIVQLATISRNGKPIEMSTRKGRYITLKEVLDEVGVDASRFFFLMRKTSSHLNFDLETAKKQTSENPVYYVQYAHARICSILRQAGYKPEPAGSADLSVLREPEETALMRKLWQFSFILLVCLRSVDPYMLTVYLQEAAESFHKFYDKHRVLGQDEGVTRARLSLIFAAKVVLAQGLHLLGVSQPEQM
jgi:arginyl-tRNA synthetase